MGQSLRSKRGLVMQWIWWLAGIAGAYWYDARQTRLAALQSIDVALLVVKGETQNAADNANSTTSATGTQQNQQNQTQTTTQSITTAGGATVTAESTLTSTTSTDTTSTTTAANTNASTYYTAITALSNTTQASQYLSLAAELQGAGYPIAANSVAALGMTLIETNVVTQP